MGPIARAVKKAIENGTGDYWTLQLEDYSEDVWTAHTENTFRVSERDYWTMRDIMDGYAQRTRTERPNPCYIN